MHFLFLTLSERRESFKNCIQEEKMQKNRRETVTAREELAAANGDSRPHFPSIERHGDIGDRAQSVETLFTTLAIRAAHASPPPPPPFPNATPKK